MAAVIAAVPAVDATLEGTARSTLGKMTHELGTLQQKVVQAAKRRDDTLRRQFERARGAGLPRRRAAGTGRSGLVWLLNRVGPALRRDPRPRAAGRPRPAPVPTQHWVAGSTRSVRPCGGSARPSGSSRPLAARRRPNRKTGCSRASRLEVRAPALQTAAPKVKARRKRRVAALSGRGLRRARCCSSSSVLAYYYVTLSRVIEARLHGEVERVRCRASSPGRSSCAPDSR